MKELWYRRGKQITKDALNIPALLEVTRIRYRCDALWVLRRVNELVYEFYRFGASESKTVLFPADRYQDDAYIPFHLHFKRRYDWDRNIYHPLVFVDFEWSSERIKRD